MADLIGKAKVIGKTIERRKAGTRNSGSNDRTQGQKAKEEEKNRER